MVAEKTKTEAEAAKERVKAALRELDGKIDRGDLRVIANKTGYSWNTVQAYLLGIVSKMDCAMEILKTGKEILAEREQILNS